MKYKYLLFDLDGTLIDTAEGVLKSAKYALEYFGIKKELSELKPFLGPPLTYSFTEICGLTSEEAVVAIEKYRERYRVKCNEESKVYDEIPELLRDLKDAGYILGVATSKLEQSAVNILKYFGIADYFEYITGSNPEETISKKHEVIEEALRRFGIENSRNEALMIGDMKYDDVGAKAVGIDCYGVYTGTAKAGEHEEAGATYVAKDFGELREGLLGKLYF